MSLLQKVVPRDLYYRLSSLSSVISNHSSAIPQQLHFVWTTPDGSSPIPAEHQRYYGKWNTDNDGWKAKIHQQDSIAKVVANYQQYAYDCYSKNIQRCDALRPMLLHELGGVYSDLDVEPRRPLDRLFSMYPHANVLLVEETELSRDQARQIGLDEPIRNGVPEIPLRVASYFMASVPGHPFWLEIMGLMKQRCHLPVRNEYDVIYTTGPDVVTEVAHRAVQCYSDVVIVPRRVIKGFITHHCASSWRQS